MAAFWSSLRPVRPKTVKPIAAAASTNETIAGGGGEALILHPHVLLDRVEREVHVGDLHVVRPQRRVVGVEDDRRLLAAADRAVVLRLQLGGFAHEDAAELSDVGRRGRVRDAGAGVAVVRGDGLLHRVDVRDALAALRRTARPVRGHGEARPGRQLHATRAVPRIPGLRGSGRQADTEHERARSDDTHEGATEPGAERSRSGGGSFDQHVFTPSSRRSTPERGPSAGYRNRAELYTERADEHVATDVGIASARRDCSEPR